MQDEKYVVLCIDDDSDILLFLRTVLEKNGYVMAEALSAEKGLKVYKKSNPDLVIVDLMMEEVDSGTSFVKELQALGNKAPIYLLSSAGDSFNLAIDYSSLGLAGVIQKPLSIDKLLAMLKAKLR